jgi:hypothetical protein
LPASIPEPVHAIVDKALEKDPADRYQHMQDLVVDLRRAVRKSSAPQPTGSVDAVPAKHARVAWLVAGGLAVALAAALVPATRYYLRTPPPVQQMKFAIPAPGFTTGLAISPDGRDIAYVAVVNGKRSIWLRPIASLESYAVLGTEDAGARLFWSPDSRSLGFIAHGKLQRVEAHGGTPQVLAETMIDTGGSWSRDGTILFTRPSAGFGAITKVAATGGAATPVTQVDTPREGGHLAPMFLPDGRTFLFFSIKAGPQLTASLAVGALGETKTMPLVALGAVPPAPSVTYAHGILFYTREGGTLYAQRFDVGARALKGSAVQVADHVFEVTASENGTLVYVTAPQSVFMNGVVVAPPRELVWFESRRKSSRHRRGTRRRVRSKPLARRRATRVQR